MSLVWRNSSIDEVDEVAPFREENVAVQSSLFVTGFS
jgi:hypothetical protein